MRLVVNLRASLSLSLPALMLIFSTSSQLGTSPFLDGWDGLVLLHCAVCISETSKFGHSVVDRLPVGDDPQINRRILGDYPLKLRCRTPVKGDACLLQIEAELIECVSNLGYDRFRSTVDTSRSVCAVLGQKIAWSNG